MLGVAIIVVCLVVIIVALLWAGSGKTVHVTPGSGIIEAIPDALVEAQTPDETLTIFSGDLAEALQTVGGGAQPPDLTMIYDWLDRLVEAIVVSGADVAVLRNVDFASQRTGDVDQLHYIAAALGWGFAARAVTRECRYVPWPISRPAGRVRAGMGVISRYALVQNVRQHLPPPRGLSYLVRRFASWHTMQMVDVQCGRHAIRVLQAHMAERPTRTRQRQMRELAAFASQAQTPLSILLAPAGVETCEAAAELLLHQGSRSRWRSVVPHGLPLSMLIGDHLRVLETRAVPLHETIEAHPSVVIRLGWNLPLIIS